MTIVDFLDSKADIKTVQANRQWMRKTKWLLLGLTAPEMVVYVAWRQRREAGRLLKDVKERLGQVEEPSRFGRIWKRCCEFFLSSFVRFEPVFGVYKGAVVVGMVLISACVEFPFDVFSPFHSLVNDPYIYIYIHEERESS